MRVKKYTLPRHTNLAGQGPRLGAFFIDLAIAVALTLVFLFGIFQFVFKSTIKPLSTRIDEVRVESHLFYKNKDGGLDHYGSDVKSQKLFDSVSNFYLKYIPYESEDADIPVTLENGKKVEKSKYFTAKWFNENILLVESDGEGLFEYQTVGEKPDKSLLAKINPKAEKSLVNRHLSYAWVTANRDLNKLPSFRKLNNEYGFYNTLELVICAVLASSITYIVIPIILKNGKTVGKKVFGLCLADKDGYIFKNHQLFMRIMPLFVVFGALFIPIWNSMISVLVMFLVIGLVSFTLSMASPKKAALHDFTARTIVVNARTSILFNNSAEEEEYIAKEDNLEYERKDVDGEEPALRYER